MTKIGRYRRLEDTGSENVFRCQQHTNVEADQYKKSKLLLSKGKDQEMSVWKSTEMIQTVI